MQTQNNPNASFLLEIAVFNIASAIIAANAGADRIELCENPLEGGTTASYGTLKMALEKVNLPVFPIIRPRGGDFLYTSDEFEIMKKDVLLCKALGFQGIVTGALCVDGSIDVVKTSQLTELAYPLEVTFHRAFDRSKDPFQSLEDLIHCGCSRILTSGQVSNAFDGKELIKQLIVQAAERIVIMPGSGIRSTNVKEIASYTGAVELHASSRKTAFSAMQFINNSMTEPFEIVLADEAEIKKMKRTLEVEN